MNENMNHILFWAGQWEGKQRDYLHYFYLPFFHQLRMFCYQTRVWKRFNFIKTLPANLKALSLWVSNNWLPLKWLGWVFIHLLDWRLRDKNIINLFWFRTKKTFLFFKYEKETLNDDFSYDLSKREDCCEFSFLYSLWFHNHLQLTNLDSQISLNGGKT